MWIVHALEAYLLFGVLFAVPFLARGARALYPAAGGGSAGFRILIFPGVVALWPFLARRWAATRAGEHA